MARIGINARLLLPNKLEGIGRFSHEVLKRLVQFHPEHEFHFYFDRAYDHQFIYGMNVIPHVVSPQARHPILYKIWFNWRLPWLFKKHKIDVFFSPDGYLSLNTQIPQIQVVHDLVFEHFPWMLRKRDADYYRKQFPLFCNNASHILAVSQYTSNDIQRLYGIQPNKISLTCNGVSDVFKPLSTLEKEEFKKQYTQGRNFWIFYGAIHPRKNLESQLKAFDAYKGHSGSNDVFVLAGRFAWKNQSFEKTLDGMAYKNDVVFTGKLSDSELASYIGASRGLMYVSLFEGFGIPILEAMACGVPVITSTTSSMPEIAGNAALFCHPDDIDDMALQMERISRDEHLVSNMVGNGFKQVQKYSWEIASNAVWEALIPYLN